jgi:hypothetical protein
MRVNIVRRKRLGFGIGDGKDQECCLSQLWRLASAIPYGFIFDFALTARERKTLYTRAVKKELKSWQSVAGALVRTSDCD